MAGASEGLLQFYCRECKRAWYNRTDTAENRKCHRCNNECEGGLRKEEWREDHPLICHFKCECGRHYTVKCRRIDTAKCYGTGTTCVDNEPYDYEPPRRINRKPGSSFTHSCSRCNSSGKCSNLSWSQDAWERTTAWTFRIIMIFIVDQIIIN